MSFPMQPNNVPTAPCAIDLMGLTTGNGYRNNDSYSLAVIAVKLKEAFGLDVNKLRLSFDIGWYEQKAVAVLLALLSLGFKNIRIGPTLPAFLSPGVTGVPVKTFGFMPTTTLENDLNMIVTAK